MSEARLVDLMAPVGPVAERFIGDQRVLTGIMGPYGSGKTTTCFAKIWSSIALQPLVNGTRKARWAVVRDTYQQLETNVLNSWFTWFPKTRDNWNGREMCHRLRYRMVALDGSPPEIWELEMYFRAMGDQKAEAVLKGLELTGLWLNETDTLDKAVLRFGLPRTGRYPSAKDGGCGWSGVIADFNAPDIDNWTYEVFVDKKLGLDDATEKALKAALGPRYGVGFHEQPGGRSVDPEPENLRNLEAGYYEKLMIGLSPADIRRFVDNQFGAVYNGQPVFPEYNDDFHCAKEPLKPIPGIPIYAGLDGGRTPSLVFGQRLASGQIRTINEVVVFDPSAKTETLERMGSYSFGEIVGTFWAENYGHCEFGGIWGDPAIWYGGTDNRNDDRMSWIKEFEDGFKATAHFKVKVKPAPVDGNRLSPRLEAVRSGLVHNAAGGEPGQLISPTCSMLRRGFKGRYVILRESLSNGSGRFQSKPLKDDYSQVHDAKQYLDLGLTKRGAAMASGAAQARGKAPRRPRVNQGNSFFANRA